MLDLLNRSVGQIGFVVDDVEEKIDFYHKNFGISGWHVYTYGHPFLQYMRYRNKPVLYKARIALNYFGDTRIELIQNLEGTNYFSEFSENHGFGVHHLGIYIDDMKAAQKKILDAGFSIVMEGGGFGLDGDGHFAYISTEEDGGICYELIERPKRRPEPEMILPV